ncbi:hypothetical protein LCGC14_1425880 [marine sediment metagenome]|uniref:Bacteriophage Mu GpT domain-containing protein n=1 Tax=marine sediment metagenome TaxID=412755 RepID=A0A0F9KB36_9ZZZZ
MEVQGALNLLFRSGLRSDFRDEFNEHETQYSQYLKVGSMDGPEIEATIIAGLRRLLEIGDGEPVTYEDVVLGPKVIGIDKEFGLGFTLTRKTVEDDQYNKANQGAKWLAHATQMTYEYRGGALLDDAFAGSTFKGIDSLPLCDESHTSIGHPLSTTWANEPANAIGFSIAGINALLNLHEGTVDHNGDPVITNPDTVIYNPSQITKAMQIFGSKLEPFTADNQDNVIGMKRLAGVKQVVKRFVTSTTTYFLFDSKMNDAHFLLRRKADFKDEEDFDTGAAKFKTTTRFLIWFVDPRGWTGSNAS